MSCPRCAQLEDERDTLQRALEESRGQVRTLRLTLDQQVDLEAELEESLTSALDERDALRDAVRAYLAAREQMGADDMPEGSLDTVFTALKEAEARLLALLPPEEP